MALQAWLKAANKGPMESFLFTAMDSYTSGKDDQLFVDIFEKWQLIVDIYEKRQLIVDIFEKWQLFVDI